MAVHAHDFSLTMGIGLSEEADALRTHLEWVDCSLATVASADDAAVTIWSVDNLSR